MRVLVDIQFLKKWLVLQKINHSNPQKVSKSNIYVLRISRCSTFRHPLPTKKSRLQIRSFGILEYLGCPGYLGCPTHATAEGEGLTAETSSGGWFRPENDVFFLAQMGRSRGLTCNKHGK